MALDIVTNEPQTDDGEDLGGGLADHEAEFSRPQARQPEPEARETAGPDDEDDEPEPGAAPEARDDKGRFTRHRAQSQKATAADVGEIGTLTKELRAKEAELKRIKPDAVAGSPRLLALKRQIAALNAELAEHAPKPAKAEAAPAAPTTFDEKEPTLDDFKDKDDPYLALSRALSAYDRRKEAFEAGQQAASAQVETDKKAEIERYQAAATRFAKTHDDFDAVTAELSKNGVPSLLAAAIIKSANDKGPEALYYLAQHQDALDELVLLTDGKPVTEQSVAIVQRRLAQVQHVQAAQQTGSAAIAQTSYIPPRPPNPVRTGPIRTEEPLPGDESSLAEHERAYHKTKRR